MAPAELGALLRDRRQALDRGEGAWLDALVDFDLAEAWQADGCFSAPGWLMWACGMARSTAYEKVSVAHELRRRPVIGEALRSGDISYSAARAIAKLEDTSPEVDQALVDLARVGTVRDLDRALDYYMVLHDQEHDGRPWWARNERRGVKLRPGLGDGLGQTVATLTNTELAEFEAVLKVFIDRSAVDESAQADGRVTPASVGEHGPVDESTHADGEAAVDVEPPTDWRARRADAFMEMVRTALIHARDGQAVGADRYMVHAVVDIGSQDRDGRTEMLDGTLVDRRLIEKMACDCSVVAHVLRDGTEPVALGRKTRVWSIGQRRAIAVRDGGRCRWPGCTMRITDVHHIWHWTRGGPTDVDNGALHCDQHHTLLHKGFEAVGSANGNLTYLRPDGTVLGTSAPPARTPDLLPRAA